MPGQVNQCIRKRLVQSSLLNIRFTPFQKVNAQRHRCCNVNFGPLILGSFVSGNGFGAPHPICHHHETLVIEADNAVTAMQISP